VSGVRIGSVALSEHHVFLPLNARPLGEWTATVTPRMLTEKVS